MSKRGWVLFVAMGVIWGIPYLLIKVAVEEVSPSTMVLARCAIAALLLMPIALARGQVRAVLPRWKPLALFAVVEICVPWLMLGFAEQQISSSLTGLLIAAVPLVGALLARYGPAGDALDGRRVVGLLVGLAGVSALVGFEVAGRRLARGGRHRGRRHRLRRRPADPVAPPGRPPGDRRDGVVTGALDGRLPARSASRRHPTTGRPARSSPPSSPSRWSAQRSRSWSSSR